MSVMTLMMFVGRAVKMFGVTVNFELILQFHFLNDSVTYCQINSLPALCTFPKK